MTRSLLSARTLRGACAAMTAAVLTATALTADAIGTKPIPESLSFKAGKSLVKDNTVKEAGGPQGLINISLQNLLNVRGVNVKKGAKGLVVTKTLVVFARGIPDPRGVVFPVTYAAGTGVGGSYEILTTTTANPNGTSQLWGVDPLGATPFQLRVLKYDAVTHRMSGTFTGTMKATALGQKDLKITAGKFAIDMEIQDMSPPPVGKR
ncbi:MAG: hypothetical protein K8T90_15880 [Planctomycetes bacterium]|nr:hypothetical protein [Planctomycetota bacterium]